MSGRLLIRRLWVEFWRDDVPGRAAQLSYFFLLSLFPLLLLLTTLLGYITAGSDLRADLLEYFARMMPPPAFELVSNTLDEITRQRGGGKISIGILFTLWAAANGVESIMGGLNAAYEVKEARPWWQQRVIAIALTMLLAALTVTALALVLYGGNLGGLIAGKLGLGDTFRVLWALLQWPLVVVFLLVAFGMLYWIGPNVEEQRWRYVWPGAVTSVALWLVVSFGLRIYLMYFDSYSKVYGSLGALIVLMLWFYLSGAAILVGGELNSELEAAAARSGEPDAKLPGQRKPGGPRRRFRLRRRVSMPSHVGPSSAAPSA